MGPALAVLLIGVAAGLIWKYAIPSRAALPPLVAVRSGAVEEALEVDALVIRSEQVVVAPTSGSVKRLVGEGEKVRLGAPVVAISPATASAPAVPPAPVQPVANPGTSAAEREYDRLTGQIYQLAVALNQAKYGGETEKAAELEEQLDSLARQQAALLDQTGTEAPSPISQVLPPTGDPDSPDPLATRVVADAGGIVLYQTDGLEAVLTPEQAETWTASWIRSLPYPEQKQTGSGLVAPGQPLFKVVDEMDLELMIIVPAQRLTGARRTLIQQDGITLRLPNSERTLAARVKSLREEGEDLLIHLVVPMPASEVLSVRRLRATLLMEVFEGIIIPRSAIDVQDGKQGVWTYEAGTYEFLPVRVVGGNQQEIAVTGDLDPDAQVLQTPPPSVR